MGLFSLLSDFADESKPDPLAKAVDNLVGGMEKTLGNVLDKAEGGIKAADGVVSKLENGSDRLAQQADVISTKLSQD